MKRKIMQIIAVILTFVIVQSSFTTTTLANQENKTLRTSEEAKVYVEQYAKEISDTNICYSVKGCKSINSFTGDKEYILYSLDPMGYAIYDTISGVVEEMMLDSENPYNGSEDKNLYYGGPMNYITESEGVFFSLNDKCVLSQKDVFELTEIERYTHKNRQNVVKGIPHDTRYFYMNSSTYFTSMLGERFGYNVNGTCTQIACAIMLGYYNYYINSRYVPTSYEDSCGTKESFHIHLQSFLGTGGCTIPNAASGLNSYFSAINFTTPTVCYDVGNHNTVYTRVNSRVTNNKPTVIAMFTSYNSNCTMNHSVVAYGYREEWDGGVMTSAAYFVHNGWHGTKTGTYAWDWFADDLYIL